jgi:hypothetical protein
VWWGWEASLHTCIGLNIDVSGVLGWVSLESTNSGLNISIRVQEVGQGHNHRRTSIQNRIIQCKTSVVCLDVNQTLKNKEKFLPMKKTFDNVRIFC